MGVQVPVVASSLSRGSPTLAAAHGHQHVRAGAAAATTAAAAVIAIDGFQRNLQAGNAAVKSDAGFGLAVGLQHVRLACRGEL